MGGRLNWVVEDMGMPVRISHKITVWKVEVSLNWAVGELGRSVRISHKTTVGEV